LYDKLSLHVKLSPGIPNLILSGNYIVTATSAVLTNIYGR